MEIRDLRYFCLTAELEHVTKAADQLGVSQPFLTKIIGQLENEIGVPLFDNIGRKIKLNEYGEAFYIQAKKVLNDVDNIYAQMDYMLDRRDKTIRILSNIGSYSPEMVLAFQKEHPEYTLSIEFAYSSDIINAIISGNADFAFCSPPLLDDPIKGIKSELVFCEYCCVLLPPGLPLLGRDNVTFEDLEDEPLVTTPRGSGLRINIDRVFEKYNYRPQIVCESNDMSLLIRAVRDGLGYAIIPRWQAFSNPGIMKYCVNVDMPDAKGYIGMSYSTAPKNRQAAKEFAEFAKKFLADFVKVTYPTEVKRINFTDYENDVFKNDTDESK